MLTLSGLSKRYGEVVALDGLDLEARPGRIVGFLGPNGAGKTTAMRSIFGLVRLDAGTVRWRDQSVGRDTVATFGYMPEQRGLYPKMTAVHQVAYFGELHGMDPAVARRAAAEQLELLGLGDRLDDPVSSLSHGNQQRVQLAVSLVHTPDLLVLDEPFSGLDPIGRAQMERVIRTQTERGATVVFSSHQLDLVQDLVDDVVIVAGGRGRIAGTLEEVRRSVGRHDVTVQTDGTDLPDIAGLTVTERFPGGVRGHVPMAVTPAELLALVPDTVPVSGFRFEPPALSTVFVETVGESLQAAEVGA